MHPGEVPLQRSIRLREPHVPQGVAEPQMLPLKRAVQEDRMQGNPSGKPQSSAASAVPPTIGTCGGEPPEVVPAGLERSVAGFYEKGPQLRGPFSLPMTRACSSGAALHFRAIAINRPVGWVAPSTMYSVPPPEIANSPGVGYDHTGWRVVRSRA